MTDRDKIALEYIVLCKGVCHNVPDSIALYCHSCPIRERCDAEWKRNSSFSGRCEFASEMLAQEELDKMLKGKR